MPIHVLLADDHPIYREGLRSVLSTAEDMEIVAEATTGTQAVQLTVLHNPDIVLLDVRMPKLDGLGALGRIKIDDPHVPVLMLSGFDNPTYMARADKLRAQLGWQPRSLEAGMRETFDWIRQTTPPRQSPPPTRSPIPPKAGARVSSGFLPASTAKTSSIPAARPR